MASKRKEYKPKPMVKKAKFIEKYVDVGYQGVRVATLVYEYRGCRYEVEDNPWIWYHPTWMQHKEEQRKIDEFLDNPKPPEKEHTYEDTAEYAFNKLWDYWNSEDGEWAD